MEEIPVYLFTGFLDAGKTKFIQETLEDMVNFDLPLMPLAFPQRTNKGSKLQLLWRRHGAGRRKVGCGAMGRDIQACFSVMAGGGGLAPGVRWGDPRGAAPHPAGPRLREPSRPRHRQCQG